MKVIVFCASLQTGGAERVLSVLSKPFADHYDEVEYVTWYNTPIFYSIDDRIKLVSIEKECKGKSILKKMMWLRKYIRTGQPDVILSFSAPFNMLILTSLLFLKKKIIVCERTDPRSFRWGKHLELLRNALYLNTTGILTQTQISKSYFKGKLLAKTSIIYNPISMDLNDVGSALREKKENLIVTAARLAKEKRHDLLIRSFAKFRLDFPDYKLIIYGEGAERNRLNNLIKDLGLENCVFLPGKVKDLWIRIRTAKVFIMTSKVEGMSNSMIEAMALGIPTISTRVSGATDLINNNENGILVNPDIDEIYNACYKICTDRNIAIKLGSNGIKIFDRLKVEKISKEWIDYIDSITNSK
ncbi:MAG: glycosyltransferase, partial [Bacilli bacterium]|nr:glycosyltransferase [Bacilli bacterium]